MVILQQNLLYIFSIPYLENLHVNTTLNVLLPFRTIIDKGITQKSLIKYEFVGMQFDFKVIFGDKRNGGLKSR